MKGLGKEAWIDAALAMLEENGSSGLSVVKLATKLNVTRGSFYHHFQSLDDLIDQMIARWERGVIDRVFAEARELSVTPGQKIKHLIDQVTRLTDKQDLLFRQWAPHNERVQQHMERLDQKRLAIMTEMFQRFVGDDLLGERFARLSFYAYIGCLNSYPRPSSALQKEMSLEILSLIESFIKQKRLRE